MVSSFYPAADKQAYPHADSRGEAVVQHAALGGLIAAATELKPHKSQSEMCRAAPRAICQHTCTKTCRNTLG